MENNKPTTGKFALNYGALVGGISVVFVLMLYSMDMHYQGGGMVIGVTVILSLAVVVLGMIQFKKANNGFMSFGQGLKVGVGISLVAGVIGIIMNQIMQGVIDPEMMDKAIEFQKGTLMEAGMTSDQIDAQLKMGESFRTPMMQIMFGLLFSIVFGFIYSLIPALILKKTETNQ